MPKPIISVEATREPSPCTICQERPTVATLLISRRQPIRLCLDHARALRRSSHKALSQRLCYGEGSPIESISELLVMFETHIPRSLWHKQLGRCISIYWLQGLPFRYLLSLIRNKHIAYREPVPAKPINRKENK